MLKIISIILICNYPELSFWKKKSYCGVLKLPSLMMWFSSNHKYLLFIIYFVFALLDI